MTSQIPNTIDSVLSRFLIYISESDIIESIAVTEYHTNTDWKNKMVSGSVFKNHMGRHNTIGKIEDVLSRTSRIFFLGQNKKIYRFEYGSVSEITLDPTVFVMGGEIVQMAAGYGAFFILVKYANGNTRVFCDKKVAKTETAIGATTKVLISDNGNNNYSSWVEILDFKELLQPGEHIVHLGCATFTYVFISSRGKLFSVGSNQFAEMGIGMNDSLSISEIKPCVIDPECTDEPFFVKTVHGDHNIVALTIDGRVFICGYSLSGNGAHQQTLVQVKPNRSTKVVFTDICASYYSLYGLTSKFNTLQYLT